MPPDTVTENDTLPDTESDAVVSHAALMGLPCACTLVVTESPARPSKFTTGADWTHTSPDGTALRLHPRGDRESGAALEVHDWSQLDPHQP